ncbi:MAG: hypothetical protein D4R44_06920 [Actinobacteria bacterium]|nr:MAG: hypothetical protein D4R44_06920 [Actinomycetota bacterium]
MACLQKRHNKNAPIMIGTVYALKMRGRLTGGTVIAILTSMNPGALQSCTARRLIPSRSATRTPAVMSPGMMAGVSLFEVFRVL